MYRDLDDEVGIAWACYNLGLVAYGQGDLAGADAEFREALALMRAHANQRGTAVAFHGLGTVAGDRGDPAGGRVLRRGAAPLAGTRVGRGAHRLAGASGDAGGRDHAE